MTVRGSLDCPVSEILRATKDTDPTLPPISSTKSKFERVPSTRDGVPGQIRVRGERNPVVKISLNSYPSSPWECSPPVSLAKALGQSRHP